MYPNEIKEAINAIEKNLGHATYIRMIRRNRDFDGRYIYIFTYEDNDSFYCWDIEKKTFTFVEG